jgi:predicted branched-subunit amino acid permease
MAQTTRSDSLADFRRGYLALLPLWSGAIPAGVAYGVAARSAGLSVGETQLMSLLVFSAAGQIGAVSLIAGGASPLLLIGTVMALNAQLVLLGLAIGRQLQLSWLQRLATAWLLTDGAYGVSLGVGPLRLAVLLGAGASMYTGWNIGTALGAGDGAGVDVALDRMYVAHLLGMHANTRNSLDGVGDRDFAVEALASLALLDARLTRLLNDPVLLPLSRGRERDVGAADVRAAQRSGGEGRFRHQLAGKHRRAFLVVGLQLPIQNGRQ